MPQRSLGRSRTIIVGVTGAKGRKAGAARPGFGNRHRDIDRLPRHDASASIPAMARIVFQMHSRRPGIRPISTGQLIPVAVLIALLASSCAIVPAQPPPIAEGDHVFQHRFAEHPDMPSVVLAATIKGSHITLTNSQPSDVFPRGIVAEGTLMWHARTRQWIIGDSLSDKDASEVGGCSAGPEVVDLQNRICWTC